MTAAHSTPTIGATVHGFPRIGRQRQLKFALDAYWGGRSSAEQFDQVAYGVRLDALYTMSGAGLTSIPVNSFSWYDQMLDASVLFGAIPERFAGIDGDHRLGGISAAQYFAMARGTDSIPPMEMTKWFDTNYHYLVPEIGPSTAFTLDPTKILAEFDEAASRGYSARPVIPGPWTYLALAKPAEGSPEGFAPLDRLDELVGLYAELLGRLAERGVAWVQLDEPALVRDLSPNDVQRVASAYAVLGGASSRPALYVATYFGTPDEALPALAQSSVEAIGLDLTRGATPDLVDGLDLSDKTLVLGVVNGRNIWRTDLTSALDGLRGWTSAGARLAVSSSCSLLHVPYDVRGERELDPALRDQLAFADQKLQEVLALQRALDDGTDGLTEIFEASDAAAAARDRVPGVRVDSVRERLASVAEADRTREDREQRTAAQRERLNLPGLPTTTIGSFPQTRDVRRARAQRRAGTIDENEYVRQMQRHIEEVIDLQKNLGLDVLVHGEPERNDMVQYFAEQLDGYASTENGWVQSYGSRCVRPPILYGDVTRPEPMTVSWATYARDRADQPVKGMLTGPVTMLAWSFVRDDQPRSVTADSVALALRDEVADLEAAGLPIIQVDEPALRETLPLRAADQKEYLAWAVGSFRLATGGVRVDTQIHTHLCYSEFGEIIGAIDQLDADVTSIEAARSKMELLDDVKKNGFGSALGPGVWDIHSPRIPSTEEIVDLLRAALATLEPGRLWVNPDCGLKTRSYDEVEQSLAHLVEAAQQVRAEAGV